MKLITNEFVGWFYLYQLAMYSIQFWNAYMTYAAVNGIVVLVSGFLNIFMVYRNEHTIQKLTKYVTAVKVITTGGCDYCFGHRWKTC